MRSNWEILSPTLFQDISKVMGNEKKGMRDQIHPQYRIGKVYRSLGLKARHTTPNRRKASALKLVLDSVTFIFVL